MLAIIGGSGLNQLGNLTVTQRKTLRTRIAAAFRQL